MLKIFLFFLVSILGGVLSPGTSEPPHEFIRGCMSAIDFSLPLTTQPAFPPLLDFPLFPTTQPVKPDLEEQVRTLQLKVFILELEYDILKYEFDDFREKEQNPIIKQREYLGC